MQQRHNKEFYDFGGFRLDAANRLLRRGEKPVALTLKEFELLLFLVENAGQVVEKNSLLDAIWKDVFIEEGTLTRTISRLRKKLETETNGEKIIETLPKRGYRFLPAVVRREIQMPAAPLVVEEQTRAHIRVEETLEIQEGEKGRRGEGEKMPLQISPSPHFPLSLSPLLLALGALAIAAIGFAVYQTYFRRSEPKAIVAASVAPFSGAAGRENTPAFAPDGKQLAYAWNGGDGNQTDIYVRLVGAGEPVRLTDTETSEQHPVFSPDGLQIAFVRELKTHGEVVIVPALGGTERRVCKLFSGFASVSFAPDGKTIAVVDTADSADGKPHAVYLVNLQTGERRRAAAPQAEFRGETTPRFSPDGKQLAFVRVFDDKTQDLFVVPTTGDAPPRQLTFDRKIIHSLAWSADGAAVFFVSFRGSNRANLWRMAAAAGGEPEIISMGGRLITNISAAPDGKTIAFVENAARNLDIWRAAADESGGRKLIFSIYDEFYPAFAPDNSRIVFASNRSGKNELWMTDAAGKNLRQLTQTDVSAGSPSFSPDGLQIAFDGTINDSSGVFVVSAEGGAPRRLTAPTGARNFNPSWSADAAWIYFTSNRSGEMNIWKMPAGGGEAIQITHHGAFQAQPAPDGATIFYTKTNNAAELWRASTGGDGDEKPVPEFAAAGFAGKWTTTRAGIYFLAQHTSDFFKIKFYDFASKKIKDVSSGDGQIPSQIHGSPVAGSNFFLYVRENPDASSIMLAELGK